MQTEGHINADDLYKIVEKDHPDIGIATVRRSLNLFVKCKVANKVRFGDGKTVYEHKNSHHDHLICMQCGKIIEFRNDEIEKLQDEVAKKNHFKVSKHKLEIYGYCENCSGKINLS
jgi:Fur family ferric uptake transcriptional regulator